MRRIESGTLRTWSHSARAEECENNTGARDTRMASTIVASETWARSTSIPTRFISRTTSSPNGVRPLCFALSRSEEHTSELQSLAYLVCRLLLEKKNLSNLQNTSRAIYRRSPTQMQPT